MFVVCCTLTNLHFVAIIPNGGDFHALHSQQVGTNGGSFTRATWS